MTPAQPAWAIDFATANPLATTTITLAGGTYSLTTNLPNLAATSLKLQGPASGSPAILNEAGLSSGPIMNIVGD